MNDSKPDTIAELFARDPLNYRTGDVDAIIEAQREARRLYKQGGKPQSSVKREVNLDDLGLLA
jgi:hypothetical protein